MAVYCLDVYYAEAEDWIRERFERALEVVMRAVKKHGDKDYAPEAIEGEEEEEDPALKSLGNLNDEIDNILGEFREHLIQ